MHRRVGFLLGLLALVLAAPVELHPSLRNLIEIQKPSCLQIVGCCPVEIRVRLLPEADRATFQAWLNGHDITFRFAAADGITLKALVIEADGLRVYPANQPRLILRGLNLLTVKASQGKRYSDMDSRLFYARRPQGQNHAPTANAGPDQTAHVDDTVTLDGSASSDVDGDALTFAWSFVSRPAGSAAALSDHMALRPTFTVDEPGSYVVELVVNDGHQDSTPDTVTITTVNSKPVAKAGPDQTVHVGETVTLDGSASSDVDGDPLTYRWEFSDQPAGSRVQLSDASAVKPSFVPDEPGSYQVQLTVNDGHQDSTPDSVTVNTVNSAPKANAGPDQTAHFLGPVTLDGSASSDVDDDPLTYKWSLTVKPSGSKAVLSDGSAQKPTFEADLPGDYVAQLIVNDGKVDSAADTVTITYSNSKPLADAGPDQEVYAGAPVHLDGSGSKDDDGDTLTYQWALVTRPANSAAVLDDDKIVSPSFTPDVPGDYVAQLMVSDGFLKSDPDTASITVKALPLPVIKSFTAEPTSITAGGSATLRWTVTGATSAGIDNEVGPVAADSGSRTVRPAATTTYTLTATNAGGTATAQATVTVVIPPPVIASFTADPTSITAGESTTLAWTVTGAASADIDNGVGSVAPGSGSQAVTPAATTTYTLTAANAGGTTTAQATVTVLPPDPQWVAPPLTNGVATSFLIGNEFLFKGTEWAGPIQTGLADGTIAAQRAAVLRGKVITRDGSPLPGVTITILNHPEYGQTLSRSDGLFDMVVNGGGPLTVNYRKTNYLPAQRHVNVPWQDFAWLPDVALIQLDPEVTRIDLPASGMQAARGRVVVDEHGKIPRQATLLFPEGTTASLVMPDGTTQAVSTLDVRATEYTVGTNGPAAMPGELPPTSSYTYAVELSADQALEAGAKSVTFSQPVYGYVEDFIFFPVGTHVPSAYYDRDKAAWIPMPDGRVIRVLSVTNGMADLDTDGDGAADGAEALALLNITDAERMKLAELYGAVTSLWRVPLTHFTSHDWNYASKFSENSIVPLFKAVNQGDRVAKASIRSGWGSIESENQVFRESVDIVGTPFSLNYASDRVRGHTASNTIKIPLIGDTVPYLLQQVELEILVAGRKFTQSFPNPGANLTYDFQWDGLDAYGRRLQGRQPVTVRTGYTYSLCYMIPPAVAVSFGLSGDQVGACYPGLAKGTRWRTQTLALGLMDYRNFGLGGWTLSVHHAYDPASGVLYLGDGTQRRADDMNAVITTVAGTGKPCGGNEVPVDQCGENIPATQAAVFPRAVAVGPDGSLYIGDYGRIRRVDQNGIITTFAGNGHSEENDSCNYPIHCCRMTGEGGPATEAKICTPSALAFGPDGSLFFASGTNSNSVGRVSPDGIFTRVAGTGDPGFSGDGGPAVDAKLEILNSIGGLAVGPDGSIYIPDGDNYRIRKVGPDGIINTIAGNGNHVHAGDGGAATSASLGFDSSWHPGVALDRNGSLYISERGGMYNYIRNVGPDGVINTVAGKYGDPYSRDDVVDGVPATEELISPLNVAVGPDGSYYIAGGDYRIRRVGPDGIINTVAGSGPFCLSCATQFSGDGGPAKQARMGGPISIALSPDGSFYIADSTYSRVRRVGPPMAGFSANEIAIASEDGSEIYQFDPYGRHLKTLNALTGATVYEFTYNEYGLLYRISDGYGRKTDIDHDGSDNPLAIYTPFNQPPTSFAVDQNGYLASITNPAGETTLFGYSAEGLLTSVTGAKGTAFTYTMSYDAMGRLIRAQDPAGGFNNLSRTDVVGGHQVSITTAMGHTASFLTETLATGAKHYRNTFQDGTAAERTTGTDDISTATFPDGTTVKITPGPDPRFGMQAPLAREGSVTTGGLTLSVTASIAATLATPNDYLSLSALTDTITVNGQTFTRTYDAATRTFTANSPLGRQLLSTIDAHGNLTASQVPGLEATTFGYDTSGRLSAIAVGSDDAQRLTGMEYGDDGYLKRITMPLSQTEEFSYEFSYDDAGRVTEQTFQPSGELVQYGYDEHGNLTYLRAPKDTVHSFTYSPVDLMASYTAPDGLTTTSYAYNNDRQLTRITRPEGTFLDFGYDPAGRLATLSLPGGGQISKTYNGTTGQLSAVAAADGGTLTFGYSGSLLSSETWAGRVAGSVSRTYDNNFRLLSGSINGGSTVGYQYDNDGLLVTAGGLALTRHAQSGLLAGTSLGGVTDVWSYNGFAEPLDYTASYNGSPIFSTQYDYGRLGRVVRKTETVAGITDTYEYDYDAAGRLQFVRLNGSPIASYSYDANGNRVAYAAGALDDPSVGGDYDVQDRLLSYGSTTYQYTANGELKSKTAGGEPTTFQYDALGNLLSVDLPNGARIQYVADGLNRRIGKQLNGTLVKGFLFGDGLRPVAELDGGNNLVSVFVYGSRVNVPDYMVKGGTTYRIISDHLGSPRLVVDAATGDIAQRMDYDEFGRVLNDTNPGFQPFGFAGGLYDPDTGLVRFGARDYDAEIGRWTAKDPILFNSGGVNLYAYVQNDPVNLTDLIGLGPGKKIGVALFYGEVMLERILLSVLNKRDYITTQPLETYQYIKSYEVIGYGSDWNPPLVLKEARITVVPVFMNSWWDFAEGRYENFSPMPITTYSVTRGRTDQIRWIPVAAKG